MVIVSHGGSFLEASLCKGPKGGTEMEVDLEYEEYEDTEYLSEIKLS